MTIHDLTTLEIIMIEVNNCIMILCHKRKELLFYNLSVFTLNYWIDWYLCPCCPGRVFYQLFALFLSFFLISSLSLFISNHHHRNQDQILPFTINFVSSYEPYTLVLVTLVVELWSYLWLLFPWYAQWAYFTLDCCSYIIWIPFSII